MNTALKKLSPYLLILFGLLLLFFIKQPEAAGVCILVGIVMIIESIWPEKWEAEKREDDKKENKQGNIVMIE